MESEPRPTPEVPRPGARWAFAALLTVFTAVYLVDLRHPFTRFGESHAAAIAKYSRNYLRFGYLPHKFMMLNVSGPKLELYANPKDHYYVDHPPLTALWASGVMAVLGDSEGTFRLALLPIILAAFVAFHRLALGLLRPAGAWTATVLFMANPMMLHYATATGYIVTPLALNLWAILFYEKWARSPSLRAAIPIVALQVLSCYSGWQGYYLAPTVLAIHLAQRRRPLTLPLAMIGLNFAVFALYLAHAYWLDPAGANALHCLLDRRSRWSSTGTFSLLGYVRTVGRASGLLFTLPLMLAGVLAAAGAFFKETRTAALRILPFSLLTLDAVLFPRICIEHEYYVFHGVAFLALAGGGVADWLLQPRPAPWRRMSLAGAAVLAAAFTLQSAAVTWKRKTETGVNAYHEALARAIRDHTSPDDRVLLGIAFQTNRGGWTASRCITLYDPEPWRFTTEDGSPGSSAPDPRTLIGELRRGSPWKVMVLTSREKVAAEIPYFAGLKSFAAGFEDVCSFWRIPLENDPFLVELGRTFQKRSADGFYFFDLTRAPDGAPHPR